MGPVKLEAKSKSVSLVLSLAVIDLGQVATRFRPSPPRVPGAGQYRHELARPLVP